MDRMEKKLLLGLVLTLIIVIIIPIYGITEPARQQAAAERHVQISARIGAETFVSNCAGCHGPRGEGGVGPSLKNTPLDRTALVEVISKGRRSSPVSMPAWSQESEGPLKKNQIEDVVNFIRNWNPAYVEAAELKHRVSAVPGAPAPGAPAPAQDQEVSEGSALFTSAGCAACHGPSAVGTAAGPDITGKTRDEIIKQVRSPRTTAMPAFPPSRLSDADLDKILAFVASLKK